MYIITMKNTFEVENEVYFAATLDEAESLKYELTNKPYNTEEWIIAVVLS